MFGDTGSRYRLWFGDTEQFSGGFGGVKFALKLLHWKSTVYCNKLVVKTQIQRIFVVDLRLPERCCQLDEVEQASVKLTKD